MVEDLLGVWRICLLCAHLRCLLLCEQAGHCRVHSLLTILRLHHPYGPVLLAPHWHHWLLCSLHVCPEDLRRSENRLKMHRPSRKQTLLNPCVLLAVRRTFSPSAFVETKSNGRVTREINNSSFWNVTSGTVYMDSGLLLGGKGVCRYLPF